MLDKQILYKIIIIFFTKNLSSVKEVSQKINFLIQVIEDIVSMY